MVDGWTSTTKLVIGVHELVGVTFLGFKCWKDWRKPRRTWVEAFRRDLSCIIQ